MFYFSCFLFTCIPFLITFQIWYIVLFQHFNSKHLPLVIFLNFYSYSFKFLEIFFNFYESFFYFFKYFLDLISVSSKNLFFIVRILFLYFLNRWFKWSLPYVLWKNIIQKYHSNYSTIFRVKSPKYQDSNRNFCKLCKL